MVKKNRKYVRKKKIKDVYVRFGEKLWDLRDCTLKMCYSFF